MIKKTLILLLSLLFFNNFIVEANDLDIQKMVVFGDSLSDEGVENNNPVLQRINQENGTNKPPIYSDESVWPTYLSDLLNIEPPTANNVFPLDPDDPDSSPYGNLKGTDYAAGQTTSAGDPFYPHPHEGEELPIDYEYNPPALDSQIDNFFRDNNTDDIHNNLFVTWIGANDILSALQQLGDTQSNISPIRVFKKLSSFNNDLNNLTDIAIQTADNVIAGMQNLHDRVAAPAQSDTNTYAVAGLSKFSYLPVIQMASEEDVPSILRQRFLNKIDDAILAYNEELQEQIDLLNFEVEYFDINKGLEKIRNTVESGQPYTFNFNGEQEEINDVEHPISSGSAFYSTKSNKSEESEKFFADGAHMSGLGQQTTAILMLQTMEDYKTMKDGAAQDEATND